MKRVGETLSLQKPDSVQRDIRLLDKMDTICATIWSYLESSQISQLYELHPLPILDANHWHI